MTIQTDYLDRAIGNLEQTITQLQQQQQGTPLYEICRTACIKQFEIALEQSGKLLKKRLEPYFASHKQADRMEFKDIFRHATKHGLLTTAACERWFKYRDNRNTTAHDYGERFAKQTLKLLGDFISDAKALVKIIQT